MKPVWGSKLISLSEYYFTYIDSDLGFYLKQKKKKKKKKDDSLTLFQIDLITTLCKGKIFQLSYTIADGHGHPQYLKIDLHFDGYFIRCSFKYAKGKKFVFTDHNFLRWVFCKNILLSPWQTLSFWYSTYKIWCGLCQVHRYFTQCGRRYFTIHWPFIGLVRI